MNSTENKYLSNVIPAKMEMIFNSVFVNWNCNRSNYSWKETCCLVVDGIND